MKKLLMVTVLLGLSLNASSLSHEEINNMVRKIKQERSGIQLDRLQTTPNPFAIVKRPEKVIEEVQEPKEIKDKKSVVYKLTAILNGAAFINGKWYRVGDKLGVYKVLTVNTENVILSSGSEKKVLRIPKKRKIL